MGCITKDDTDGGRNRNKHLDNEIKKWNRNYMKAVKVLLLGTGESGKTTIIKQMKILHMKGFTDSDRQEKVVDICQNIHESIYDLVTNMSTLKPPVVLANNESEKSASYICNLGAKEPSSYTQEYYDHVQTLWNDNGIKECYRRSNEFQLIDSAKYFLDRIKEVRNPGYTPSDQDILHCRKKTTGVQKIEFKMEVPRSFGGGQVDFWMFDVGGQRGERRKWLPVFEGIQTILFLVASSDFDQTLREETSVNRLREAVNLFDDIWHSRFLRDAGVIVFLNKQDMLKEKIESGKSIAPYFPEYKKYQMSGKYGDGSDEYTRTKYFIHSLFVDATQKARRRPDDRKSSVLPGIPQQHEDTENRECFFHFTVATDTGNINTVFESVHIIIIEENLKTLSL